jgi:hypothetical protein
MALNLSGPISLGGATTGQSINLELGNGATDLVALNDTEVRTLAGITSGVITMPTDFYGKSSGPTVVKWWLRHDILFESFYTVQFLESHPTDTNVYGIIGHRIFTSRPRLSYFKFNTSTYTIDWRSASPHSSGTNFTGGTTAHIAWDTTQNGIIMNIGGGNSGGTGIRSNHYCLVNPSTGSISSKIGTNGTFTWSYIPKYTNGIYSGSQSGTGTATNYQYYNVVNGFTPATNAIRILVGSNSNMTLCVGPTASGNQVHITGANGSSSAARWNGVVKVDSNLQIDATSYHWFNGYGLNGNTLTNTSFMNISSKINPNDTNHYYVTMTGGINSGFNNGAANGQYKSIVVAKINRTTRAIVWQKGIYNSSTTLTQFGVTHTLNFIENNGFTAFPRTYAPIRHLSDGGCLVYYREYSNTGSTAGILNVTRFDASGNHVWTTRLIPSSSTLSTVTNIAEAWFESISPDESSFIYSLKLDLAGYTDTFYAVLNLPMDGSSNFTVPQAPGNFGNNKISLTVTSSTTSFHTHFNPGITLSSTSGGWIGSVDNSHPLGQWQPTTNNFGFDQSYFPPATITSGTI